MHMLKSLRQRGSSHLQNLSTSVTKGKPLIIAAVICSIAGLGIAIAASVPSNEESAVSSGALDPSQTAVACSEVGSLQRSGNDESTPLADGGLTTTLTLNLNNSRYLQPSLYLYVYSGSTLTIDWGDGSDVTTVTGSGDQIVEKPDAYGSTGSQTITITSDVSSGPAYILGEGDTSTELMGSSYRAYLTSVKTAANAGVQAYSLYNCTALITADFSACDTSEATNMRSMFSGCSALAEVDLSGFDTSQVTNMYYMFYGCSALTGLDLSGFTTKNVTNMSYLFYNCSSLATLDLTGFDTSQVSDCSYMFRNCSSLVSLDVSSFKTLSVTNMSYMFYGCSSLTALDLSGFTTENVTNMSYLFSNCSALESLDLAIFTTENVTNMSYLFSNCTSLGSLDLSVFDTTEVVGMSHMFYNCTSLVTLELSEFDTSQVTNMEEMFYNCTSLGSLDLSGFDTSHVTSKSSMFTACMSLHEIVLGESFELDSSSNPLASPGFTEPYVATGTWQYLQEDGTLSELKYDAGEVTKALDDPEITWYASIAELQQEWFTYETETVYTGSAIVPQVVIVDEAPSTMSADGYTLTYRDANDEETDAIVDAGVYTVVVNGTGDVLAQKGFYGGSFAFSFTVLVRVISEEDFKVDTGEEIYTGSPITKEIASGLKEGVDYTVVYSNNTDIGTATITITGRGSCTGTLTYEFKIVAKGSAAVPGDGGKFTLKQQTIAIKVKSGKKVTVKVTGAKTKLTFKANKKTRKALKIKVKGKKKVIIKTTKKAKHGKTYKVKIFAKAARAYAKSNVALVKVKVR